MRFASFLHFYQPPNQKERWVRQITRESYRKLVVGMLKRPHMRMTLNINACLLELLEQYDGADVIAGLRELAERGQIELTGSAKYHPFLPLLPASEIRRQIELNDETCRRFFGDAWKPVGFFPPEMAYSHVVGEVIKSCGFQWIILDELANPKHPNLSWNTIHTIEGMPELAVFFRDRHTSFRILSAEFGLGMFTPQMLYELLGDRLKSSEYLITAMDAETFGHHRPGLEQFLFDLYDQRNVEPVLIRELLTLHPSRDAIAPRDSTWALQHRDLEQHTPFARWSDPGNPIHQLQWELTRLAIAQVAARETAGGAKDSRARSLLDESLASDQYWWASAQPWWSIEMIERGAHGFVECLRALPADAENLAQAERLYRQILSTAFDWQRSGKVDERAKEADEDVTQRITVDLPFIPKAELDAMIDRLEAQMFSAASRQEYERAAQLRNRVQELRGKEHTLTTPPSERKPAPD